MISSHQEDIDSPSGARMNQTFKYEQLGGIVSVVYRWCIDGVWMVYEECMEGSIAQY